MGSELRRITNLGPIPKIPDLTDYYVEREEIEKQSDNNDDNENEDELSNNNDEQTSENSGDSPREQQEEEEEIPIPDVTTSTTHRSDNILYPKLTRPGYCTIPP